jgi:taurine dioxygenase
MLNAGTIGLTVGPRKFLNEEAERLRSVRYEHIELRPLAPTIGAEVHGIDLARPVSGAAFAELQRAHLDWKVLFFRDQHITTEQHKAFSARFGELEIHPFLPAAEGHSEVISFAKDAQTPGFENGWHSDVTWREAPALGSLLRCREAPAWGGDTLFSDMYAAYEGLPKNIQDLVDGKTAIHDFTHTFGKGLTPQQLAKQQEQFPAVEHPIVRTHPETGRKALYVNAFFTCRVDWLPEDEGRELLELLCRQASVPEYQCRFHWETDSIAFWDNRAVQHYAASDYWPQKRVMERVTIIGDRPV